MQQTILVVDDSPTIVKFVSFSLKNRGFSVLTACDGMDAIEKISNHGDPIDLIITDLNMPNVDGYEFISTLRRNSKYQEIPIIILSSEEEEEDKQRGLTAGATSYLVKPFKSSVLLREISKFI